MNIIETKNLTFTYPGSDTPVLDNVSLSVEQGEFIVLCGESGCGKTTLLRSLKSCLAPHGEKSGEVLFNGVPIEMLADREQSGGIGFVMQDVEAQIVTDKVWHELAFGLESLGCDTEEIRTRVAEMASFFGIGEWFRKGVNELSGGQKQLMNLAAVMVMSPSVLILDEPTAQLDPIAAENFLAMLKKINRETGTAVILSEHRLEEAIPLCTRLLVMENGRIICDENPRTAVKKLLTEGHKISAALPCASRIYHALDGSGEYPITVREGRSRLEEFVKGHKVSEIKRQPEKHEGTPAAELKEVWFSYSKELDDVSRGLSLKAYKGELLAVIGGNGAGKTTALSLLSGLNKPYCGRVLINGVPIEKVKNLYDGVLGVVPQNPKLLFTRKTLKEDLSEVVSGTNNKEERVRSIAELCGLAELLERHPYDLSGGEQQRAAVAKLLIRNPEILLLDEPTKGMDAESKRRLAAVLKSLTGQGKAVIMVSHDIEFCAEYADSCAMLFDGELTAAAAPCELFAVNSLYTTAARRIARGIIDNAVTAEDIICACTGKFPAEENGGAERVKVEETMEKEHKSWKNDAISEKREDKHAIKDTKLTKRTNLSVLMLFLLIPLTILAGMFCLGDRKYYFISLLVIAEAMLPFMMIYEGRKPKPRELVTIASLCALTAAGRAAFFWLPQFKPMAALVIISGASFGGEAGFIVGAVSAFISNFYFGQGPWTPWQMFCFGVIGFIAGVLFHRKTAVKRVIPMVIYGFIAVMLIYGGIMNPAGVMMYQSNITKEMIIGAYASGLYFDLIHAVSTALFLLIGAGPMLDKLERLKTKYGM